MSKIELRGTRGFEFNLSLQFERFKLCSFILCPEKISARVYAFLCRITSQMSDSSDTFAVRRAKL